MSSRFVIFPVWLLSCADVSCRLMFWAKECVRLTSHLKYMRSLPPRLLCLCYTKLMFAYTSVVHLGNAFRVFQLIRRNNWNNNQMSQLQQIQQDHRTRRNMWCSSGFAWNIFVSVIKKKRSRPSKTLWKKSFRHASNGMLSLSQQMDKAKRQPERLEMSSHVRCGWPIASDDPPTTMISSSSKGDFLTNEWK